MAQKYRDQPVALATAAALAFKELVSPDRRPSFYDAEHLGEMLNLAAHALLRVAPAYVVDEGTGLRRQLADDELEGAVIRRGATILELANGRRFKEVTVLRDDLRDGIEILKRAGIKAFGPEPRGRVAPAAGENAKLKG